VTWRSIEHAELWTNGEAVLDPSSGALGARTDEALRRAAKSLDVHVEG
jgi:hypothetical protein